MIQTIESFLYAISTALLYPIYIGLTVLVFWVVLHAGRFTGDYMKRKHGKSGSTLWGNLPQEVFEERINQSPNPDLEILEAIFQWKEKQLKKINSIRFVVRAGPSTGLVGTLIPMGTALASLSQGDMLAMSSNMVTAFTSTIIGLSCGTLAFLIALVRDSWFRKDLHACEIYGEQLLRKISKETPHAEYLKFEAAEN
jgi:hypothetical protein